MQDISMIYSLSENFIEFNKDKFEQRRYGKVNGTTVTTNKGPIGKEIST